MGIRQGHADPTIKGTLSTERRKQRWENIEIIVFHKIDKFRHAKITRSRLAAPALPPSKHCSIVKPFLYCFFLVIFEFSIRFEGSFSSWLIPHQHQSSAMSSPRLALLFCMLPPHTTAGGLLFHSFACWLSRALSIPLPFPEHGFASLTFRRSLWMEMKRAYCWCTHFEHRRSRCPLRLPGCLASLSTRGICSRISRHHRLKKHTRVCVCVWSYNRMCGGCLFMLTHPGDSWRNHFRS